MFENDKNSENREDLKQENDFLKMKMMLEYGAEFGTAENIPAEVENEFLRSVAAFEEQYKTGNRIKVFDKIGKPQHFRAVDEIPDEHIEDEWIALLDYLNGHGIDLNVCSPNVAARELYRFAVQELFELETDDISMPGMLTCFIYDEFYPDHKYDNQRIAVEECISYFFEKHEFFDFHFGDKIQLNSRKNLTKKEFRDVVNAYKTVYSKISKIRVEAKNCLIDDHSSVVTGFYEAIFTLSEKNTFKSGNWLVELIQDKEFGYWFITKVQLDGIRF